MPSSTTTNRTRKQSNKKDDRDTQRITPSDDDDDLAKMRLELETLKRNGDRTRQAQRKELLSWRAKLNSKSRRLGTCGSSIPMELYQEQVTNVLETTPSDDAKLFTTQTKLCHALHGHEVQLRQLHIMKQHQQTLVASLKKHQRKVSQEKSTCTQELEDLIMQAVQEKRRLHEELDDQAQMLEDEICHLVAMKKKQRPPSRMALSPPPPPPPPEEEDSMFMSPVMVTGRKLKHLSSSSLSSPGSNSVIQTPLILKHSKIWCDINNNDNKSTTSTATMTTNGHDSSGSTHLFFGSSSDDTSSSNSKNRPAVSRMGAWTMADLLFQQQDQSSQGNNNTDNCPPSPTTAALKELSNEVFSF